MLETSDCICTTVLGNALAYDPALEILAIATADLGVGEDIGAKLQAAPPR